MVTVHHLHLPRRSTVFERISNSVITLSTLLSVIRSFHNTTTARSLHYRISQPGLPSVCLGTPSFLAQKCRPTIPPSISIVVTMKNHRVRTRSAASPPVVESRSHPSEGGVYYQDLIQIYPLDELTILKKPDFSVSPEFHDESLQQSWVMKHLANFYDDNPFRLARVQSDIDAGRPGGIGVMYQKPSGGWKLPENQVGPFSLDPLDLATHWHELRSQTPQSSWEKQSLVRHLRNWDKYAESGEDAAGRGDEKRESALSRKRRLLEVGDKGEGTSKRPRRSRKAAGQVRAFRRRLASSSYC